MDTSKIRIGVIGAAGGIGKQRVSHFRSSPHCVVTRVAGRSPEKLAALGVPEAHQCAWQELAGADDVDAVCVSTPNVYHEEMVAAAWAKVNITDLNL